MAEAFFDEACASQVTALTEHRPCISRLTTLGTTSEPVPEAQSGRSVDCPDTEWRGVAGCVFCLHVRCFT
jgi:hypothetical protein